MRNNSKRYLRLGILWIVLFVTWTFLVQVVDVQPVGQKGTEVGFATFNGWFHKLTDVHMQLYDITDWLGLIPMFICMMFGGMGMLQVINRKSLLKVDSDIIFLGVYYVLVIFGYLVFELFPINYRPILIEGVMEASYPSSTTLLVLSVMPTLSFQAKRRIENVMVKKVIEKFVFVFSVFMVTGRLVCGVHWFTDIVGSVILSVGLYDIYKAVVWLSDEQELQ